jgi:hypothetical protein
MLKLGGAVFDDTELSEVVPGIAAALAKAGPTQDVTFAVFGRHGAFGENSPATVTTGRVFLQAGQLNLILGLVQTRYEDVGFGGTVELIPGQRARRIAQTWSLSAEPARFMDKRSDWMQFDVARLASLPRDAEPIQERRAVLPARPSAEAVLPKTDATDPRYQDIQSRLKTLERLKSEGLITEDEYRERRRAIVQSL